MRNATSSQVEKAPPDDTATNHARVTLTMSPLKDQLLVTAMTIKN